MAIAVSSYFIGCCFFFNDTAATEIYTLSLHDALPILLPGHAGAVSALLGEAALVDHPDHPDRGGRRRSEEHTSELQSRLHLVCRLLLEKKKKTRNRLIDLPNLSD